MSRSIQLEFLLAGMLDSSGNPLSGGKIYSYEAGTNTNKNLYTDFAKTTPAANPVILDSNGKSQVFGDGAYKIIVKDSANNTLYTWDNLQFVYPDALALYCGTSTGSSNAYIASPSPSLTAYTDGLVISFAANFSNTAASTINISSLGVKTIKRLDGTTDLTTGDIISGQLVTLQYVASSGYFILQASGVIQVNGGGTGATTAAAARTNLGLGTASTLTIKDINLSGANVLQTTADGSDNGYMQIGHAAADRGAYDLYYGNEHANTGQRFIVCGNVTGSFISLSPGNTPVWDVPLTGHFTPRADNTYDLGDTTHKLRKIYLKAGSGWSPTVICSGSMTIASQVNNELTYYVLGDYVEFTCSIGYTLGGTASNYIKIPHPIAGVAHNGNCIFICRAIDGGGTVVANGAEWHYDGTYILVQKSGLANWTLGVNAAIHIQGRYRYL
jgi:hypothetical protein